MGKIRRLVLDTLKPHEPNSVELARRLTDLKGVAAVNVNIYELDLKVENAKVTLVGDDLHLPEIQAVIEELGGAVHSIDEVVAGREIIDAAETLQD